MDTSQHDLAAVEALLAERDAIHGWLHRLDGASASMPEAVRRRVRADYEQRLEGVTERLRSHADVVEAKLGADQAEYDDLEMRAVSARESLAEAELRHAVGEYDAARFDAERTLHASNAETYELSLGAIGDRIARLHELLRLLDGAPAAAPSGTGPVAEAEPVVEPFVDTPDADTIDDVPRLPEPEPDVSDADDTDQLLAIFDDDASLVVRDDHRAPLSFRPTDGHAAMRAAPAQEPVRMVPPEPVEVRSTPAPVQVIDVPPPAPPPADQAAARTVRCGECGAMNRPMEWYCEKCGAELTSV